jgi:hypothetical protein
MNHKLPKQIIQKNLIGWRSLMMQALYVALVLMWSRGVKVPNVEEQKLLNQMKRMKEKGKTIKEIHHWLNEVKNKKLAYSSLRVVLMSF